jgi:hypothetical protein
VRVGNNVIVCKPPWFGCAAAGIGEIHLLDFDEFVITLPPMVVH